MGKYCIIADIHNRTDIAEEIASEYENTHTVIFTGDYFDRFHDNEYQAESTAKWLKHSLQRPNRIHLLGNHDASYAYCTNKALWCPGWEPDKNRRIRTVLNQNDFNRLNLYHYIEEGNWLISHAGFTLPNLYGFKFQELLKKGCRNYFMREFARKDLIDYLEQQTYKFFMACRTNDYHPFMFQGTRMGEQGHGGPFWLAIQDFKPIKHFNQVVGHTPLKVPAPCYFPNRADRISTNWFIDTDLNYVALIEDGELTIKGRNENIQKQWELTKNYTTV